MKLAERTRDDNPRRIEFALVFFIVAEHADSSAQPDEGGAPFDFGTVARKPLFPVLGGERFGGADEYDSEGNLLWGVFDGEKISIEDYVIVIGVGQSQSISSRTLITLPEAARSLPDFLLTPNDWREKVSHLLGERTIDFANSPAFAKMFAVRGMDPEAIRVCFTPEVIELCMADKHLIAEVQDGVLAIQPHGKLFHPRDYPQLAIYAVHLAKALRHEAQRQS